MFDRHDFFISEELKIRVHAVKILIIGCGMGSQVAHLLVRSGFSHLTLCDGDVFETTNKNRQFCDDNSLNNNKAMETAKNLFLINKDCQINVIDRFLKEHELEREIEKHDYIINTIDFDSIDFLLCSDFCRKYQKKEIFPINLGFDGCVCFFNQKNETFSSFFQERDVIELKSKIINYLIISQGSEETKTFFKKYTDNKPKNDPQTGISTFLNASIVCRIILKDLNNEEVKLFPQFYYLGL